MLSFSELTVPVGPSEFLETFWTRRAVLLRANARRFDEFFGWDALNSILNTMDLSSGVVTVARMHEPVPADEYTWHPGGRPVVNPRAVLSLLQEGASFRISGADSYWPPLRAIVDCLYDALWETPHANVYCSPANTQGFECHFDQHEVFVFQIEGTKHWRVFEPTIEAPTRSWRIDDVPAVLATAPYLDVVLQPGDVLYVPRGHWHYATAEDSISLHITVGVTCRKGPSFLEWLIEDLRHEAPWRKNAPLMSTTAPAAGNERRQWGEGLRQSLIAKISEPDVFDRFARHIADSIEPRRTANLPYQAADTPIPVEDVVFHRPPGLHHTLEREGAVVSLSAGGLELQLEDVDAKLLDAIFSAEKFSAADLHAQYPAMTRGDLDELLSTLVRLGLLLTRPHSVKPQPTW